MSEDTCPRCGYKGEVDPGEGAGPPPRQRTIRFDIHTQDTVRENPPVSDWRLELKRRLDERAGKKPEESPPASDPQSSQTPAGEPAREEEGDAEEERPLFRYRISADPPRQADREIVTFSKKPRKPPPTFEKPLVRRTSRRTFGSLSAGSPRQSRLRLEETSPEMREEALEPEPADFPEPVSKEVLFSRVLAGMIDLSLALFQGMAFSLVAAWILDFDFFNASSLNWGGLLSLTFFLLSSLYFLATSGQTPGMYLTDLELIRDTEIREEEGIVGLGSLLLRVLFFLPVLVTGLGLLWSLLDRRCRCWHDLISGTRIVPYRGEGDAG